MIASFRRWPKRTIETKHMAVEGEEQDKGNCNQIRPPMLEGKREKRPKGRFSVSPSLLVVSSSSLRQNCGFLPVPIRKMQTWQCLLPTHALRTGLKRKTRSYH